MYNVTCVCQPMYTCTTTHVHRCTPPQRASIITDSTGPTNISHAYTVPMFVELCCYFRGSITSSCLCYMWLFFSVMSYRELAGWTTLLPLLRASPWGDTRSIHTTRPIYCVFKWMGFHVKGVICIDCVLDICWIQPTAPDQ